MISETTRESAVIGAVAAFRRRLWRLWLLLSVVCGACWTAAGADASTSAAYVSGAGLPIRPGDLVAVALHEDPDVHFEGQVGVSGLIELPYLGAVSIAGMTSAQAAAALARALEAELYQKATVSVRVVTRAPGQAYVYGAVTHPGKVELPADGNLTVIQALSEAGGITTWADPSGAHLLRVRADGERQRIALDIAASFADIGGKANLRLLPDDVIFIPSAAGRETVLATGAVEVIVTGEVGKPGIILFAPGERRTFLRAIFKAGNFAPYADRHAVRLMRVVQDGSCAVRRVDAQEIIDAGRLDLDLELQAGDMIVVDQKRLEVLVTGQVNDPGVVVFAPSEPRSLMRAILKAGNFATYADRRAVRLVRAGKDGARRVQTVDAQLLIAGGQLDLDEELRSGDMIVVDEKRLEVLVTGQVNKPGVVPFAPGEPRTLVRAILKAGNFTRFAKTEAVRLVRAAPGGRSKIETVDASRIMQGGQLGEDVELRPGDLIIVDEKRFNF